MGLFGPRTSQLYSYFFLSSIRFILILQAKFGRGYCFATMLTSLRVGKTIKNTRTNSRGYWLINSQIYCVADDIPDGNRQLVFSGRDAIRQYAIHLIESDKCRRQAGKYYRAINIVI